MNLGRDQIAIGSTVGMEPDEVLDHDSDDSDLDEQDTDSMIDDLYDLDQIFVSGVEAIGVKGVGAHHLSKIWRVSHEDAQQMLGVTSQHGNCPVDPQLSTNYGTNDRMLWYKRIKEYFYMDTFVTTKKGGKPSHRNLCCQLFVPDKGFLYVVPLKRKLEVMSAVKQFTKEIGAPDAIVCDMSMEQTLPEIKAFLNDIGMALRVLEEGTPWANKGERYIGLLKESVRKDMRESNLPLPFWDYCLEHRVRIYNMTVRDYPTICGTIPHTLVTGEESDISNLCQFSCYKWVYFHEHTAAFPHNKEVLRRVLGPARGVGNEMAQWILKANGQVVPRCSVRPLHPGELTSPSEQSKHQSFNALIDRRFGTLINPLQQPNDDDGKFGNFEPYEDNNEVIQPKPEIEDTVNATGRLLNQSPAYDHMINAEVRIQLDNAAVSGKVKRWALGPDGRMTGKYDANPYHNSVLYEVEFANGQVREYSANIIAESMLAQVDLDGVTLQLMDGVVDHKVDCALAVSKADKWVYNRHGQQRLHKTTIGWWLLVRWKDENEMWMKLSEMKESYPIEMAEYTISRGIDDEPAFIWWVGQTLKRRNAIVAALKTRMWQTKHKYGIEIQPA